MKSIVVAALAATLLSVPTTASAATDPVFPRGLPHAPSEDSCYAHRCVWDARHQGNGKGHSLILTEYRGEFLAKRITHRRAHRLQAAWCDRPSVTCEGYED